VTVASEPKRTNATALDVFVTTTVSPPPDRATLEDEPFATRLAVPVLRNGLTDPVGIIDDPALLTDVLYNDGPFVH
jgi:hypothetical protein